MLILGLFEYFQKRILSEKQNFLNEGTINSFLVLVLEG